MTSPITGLGASIERRSTTEQAAEAVRQAILAGRLLPGMPLREAAVAAELGVSRSTLREAARILASEGLVRYQMNRGIVVADITGPDVTDIYAARTVVELAAVDALTEHRDPAIYQDLADRVEQIESAYDRGEVAAVLDADRLFHATLVSAAGSSRLRRFYGQLQQEQRLALALAERSSRELGRTADDHRQLLDALRGSRAQARKQLTAHLQAGAAELQRLLDLLAKRNVTPLPRHALPRTLIPTSFPPPSPPANPGYTHPKPGSMAHRRLRCRALSANLSGAKIIKVRKPPKAVMHPSRATSALRR